MWAISQEFAYIAPLCPVATCVLCRYDESLHAFIVNLGGPEFLLDPAVVRRNDTSAKSINEWTGVKMLQDSDIADDIRPESVAPLGNYAVQILWQDGFNQVR